MSESGIVKIKGGGVKTMLTNLSILVKIVL